MPHLLIQGRDGVIGHHQAGVSVAQIFKIFDFKKSMYKLIDISRSMRALSHIISSGKHHNKKAD